MLSEIKDIENYKLAGYIAKAINMTFASINNFNKANYKFLSYIFYDFDLLFSCTFS